MDGVYLAVVVLAVLSSFEAVVPLPSGAVFARQPACRAPPLRGGGHTDQRSTILLVPRPLPVKLDLEVKDLRFRYPPYIESSSSTEGDQPYVLDGLNFDLPQGKRLAIVGRAGRQIDPIELAAALLGS